MIWTFPEVRTFIDGRMPGWKGGAGTRSQEAGRGETVFEDYIDIVELEDNFIEKIKSYGIDWFLIKNDAKITAWLLINPDWELIYEDKIAAMFLISDSNMLHLK